MPTTRATMYVGARATLALRPCLPMLASPVAAAFLSADYIRLTDLEELMGALVHLHTVVKVWLRGSSTQGVA